MKRAGWLRQLIKFGVSGSLATVVNFLVVLLCVEIFGMDPVLSTVPAFLVAFFVSYAMNYFWTFQTKQSHWRALAKYFPVAAASMGGNALIMYICVRVLHYPYLAGLVVSLMIVPILTFLLSKKLVF